MKLTLCHPERGRATTRAGRFCPLARRVRVKGPAFLAGLRPLFLVLLVVLSLPAFARKPESVDELKARAAAAREPKQQVDLFIKITERQLQAADNAYSSGDIPQARAALDDVVEYGVKAAQTSVASGKKMKHTEIALRKVSARLEDIRKTLNVDDRPPVAAAVDKLEQARTDLLSRMFRK